MTLRWIRALGATLAGGSAFASTLLADGESVATSVVAGAVLVAIIWTIYLWIHVRRSRSAGDDRWWDGGHCVSVHLYEPPAQARARALDLLRRKGVAPVRDDDDGRIQATFAEGFATGPVEALLEFEDASGGCRVVVRCTHDREAVIDFGRSARLARDIAHELRYPRRPRGAVRRV